MSAKIAVTINGQNIETQTGLTILDVCRKNQIHLPVMCHLDGLTDVGACRLCLVEIEGFAKLLPACTTRVAPNQIIRTDTEKLKKYRRITTELFFSERNHMCSVCVANSRCELQDLANDVHMTHIRFTYLFQACHVDATHPKFVMDHNRCILCSRCVRVCGEIEGAYNWGVSGRGWRGRIIADFNQPWGESVTCTACGKCVEVCPTGALWPKGISQGQLEKYPVTIAELAEKRKAKL